MISFDPKIRDFKYDIVLKIEMDNNNESTALR